MDHVGQGKAGAEQDSSQIDVERKIPVLDRNFVTEAHLQASPRFVDAIFVLLHSEAGVVDENVQSLQPFEAEIDELSGGVLLTHIADKEISYPTEGSNFLEHFFSLNLSHLSDENVGSFPGEPECPDSAMSIPRQQT